MSYRDINEEKDDFWDLDKLVPRKKSTPSPFATPTVAEHTVPVASELEEHCDKRNEEQRRISQELITRREGEGIVYHPENSLIKSVTVKKIEDKFDFYDSFRKAAVLYFDCPGERCDFAQFYSYMPQYSQLDKAQKDYYFYWRSEMRRGRFIKTDYSYVYLYVYEILNLPDLVPAEEGVRLLCRLWKEYRTALPRIDMYFSIWVSDYCLVHNLPCPTDLIREFIFDVIKVSDFKEYYFTDMGKTGKEGVWTLLAYLSDYDWQKGLYSVIGSVDTPEQSKKRELYTTLLEGAMRVILPTVWELCIGERDERKPTKISRNAFPNTLLTHSVKSKLEIEYYPIADAADLRVGITAAVRYAENKLRGVFGVRSRLSIKGLPKTYMELIDCYFGELESKREAVAKKRSLPEYERLYDAPREKLSFAGADEIERLSWDTTLRLCEDADDEPAPVYIPEPTVESNVPSESTGDDYGLTKEEIGYLCGLCEGNNTYVGDIPEETVVERINEAFSDNFGDVVIDFDGDSFTLIEDYREEITEWLKKL